MYLISLEIKILYQKLNCLQVISKSISY